MVDKQNGNFGIGEMGGGEIKDNAKVAGNINEGSIYEVKTNVKSSVGAFAGNVKGNQINIGPIYVISKIYATKLIKFDTEFTEKKINSKSAAWQNNQASSKQNNEFSLKFFTSLLNLLEKSVEISNKQNSSSSDENYCKIKIINWVLNAKIKEISTNYNKADALKTIENNNSYILSQTNCSQKKAENWEQNSWNFSGMKSDWELGLEEIREAREENSQAFFDKAKDWGRQKQFNKMLAVCELTIEIKPQAEAYLIMNQAWQKMDRTEEAIACYQKAIELNPELRDAYFCLGEMCSFDKQWEKAIKYYKISLKLKPKFAEGYRKLATALTQVGQQQEASKYLYRAYSIEPQKATAKEHLILGNTLLRQNLVNQAISCYSRAIELNPNFKDAYEYLGEALQYQAKQYQERNQLGVGFQQEWGRQAIPLERLQKEEETKPKELNLIIYELPSVGNSSIIELEKISKAIIVREALKHFERVVNELINSVTFAFNLKHDVPKSYLESSLSIQQNNYLLSPSISYPEKPEFKVQYPPANQQQPYVTVEPNLSDTYWNLSGMMSDWELGMEPDIPPPEDTSPKEKGETTSQQQWEKAVGYYRQAVELNSNSINSYYGLGEALAEKGEWEEAIACYQKVIELNDNLGEGSSEKTDTKIEIWEVYNHLGDALHELNQIEKAVEAYRRAIELAESS
jgi:tetratricopeptide (TPR) repeat protein